jgi:hypothetical protein
MVLKETVQGAVVENKWKLFNYQDYHTDSNFSLTALSIQNMLQVASQRRRAKCAGKPSNMALLALVLQRTKLHARESHTSAFACGDTAGFSPSTRVSSTHGSLLIYTPGTGSVVATPRPAYSVEFAGHDEVEVRFSQVVA